MNFEKKVKSVMTNKEKNKTSGAASKLSLPAPIHDRNQYEQELAALPSDQRELAQEFTTYADMCQYFEQHRMDMPPDIRRAVAAVGTLPMSERAAAMKQINELVMDYLHSVSDDSGLRM